METHIIGTPIDILDEISDAALVQRIKTANDAAALTTLYRRYLTPVYRYFYYRTSDVQQAEDLTARTFVAALEGLPHYRERGSFRGWLFTIAARRLADHLRRRQETLLDENHAAEIADPVPSPETLVECAEQMDHLVHALSALSPNRAQAITLHFFGELSLKETAQVMRRSKIAVKSLIHRALGDLRKGLNDERD